MSDSLASKNRPLPTVDADDRAALREATETVVVTSSSNTNGGHLHLPDGEVPRCTTEVQYHHPRSTWRTKPLAVFPEGYKPWCRFCAALFRGESDA